jgi:glycosyltransferase involved in cell wall biosynthesis
MEGPVPEGIRNSSMVVAVAQSPAPAGQPPAQVDLSPPVGFGLAHGRQRVVDRVTNRVRRDGKFFRLGSDKFYVRGVTYGPFAPNAEGHPLASRQQTRRDFELMLELGANCLRIYHVPPPWFLDLAQEMGLKIFLDVAWPKNLTFVGDRELTRQAKDAVRIAAAACGNHPAIFAISVVNEIPSDIVRFVGRQNIEQFVDDLILIVKHEAPDCLVTFANYPTTEYVNARSVDFVCFNVYLHESSVFQNYLARLQNIAGDKPLMLGEYGVDTFREHTPEKQAEILAAHVHSVFEEGLVGTFIFSFTDDWHRHGYQIEDWAFGITARDRTQKPAFQAVRDVFRKVPQTASVKIPMCSVVICSYNGAETVESCLNSMQRLRYPSYEIIFVDDGSTDNTQDILRKFPNVRNIRQKNQGLSFARNVGMNAALGEVVVYTDSDCEADEDWLYYLALSLVRSGHAGMGGPNLIPDEGSWVADCVGLSPGGPTHVMIDDRTAEHVPGCNMAFYTAILKQVNGFDSQYRKAGDDVDVIWRIQNLGRSIGFSPAAQVWHYRRNTVKGYLRQQRGYGEAEALLKYKHPDHFNTLGASHWRGKIYGGDQIGVKLGSDVVYHGIFGTGLFQTIYRRPVSLIALMLMSIEWQLLAGFTLVTSLAFYPLFFVAIFMFLTPVGLAIIAALQAPMPKHRHLLTRPLIAYLHYRQPIARGWARYSVRLKAKVLKSEVRGYRRQGDLPFDPADPDTLRYWSKSQDRLALLHQIKAEVASAGWRARVDSGWHAWDMEIYGSRYVKVRLTTATEDHGAEGMMTRVRVQLLQSRFGQVLMVGAALLAALLLLHVWPFSRPAVLIPLAWWAMYLVNERRVSAPVLGLIDAAAEKAGYYPVPASKNKKQAVADVGPMPHRALDRDEPPLVLDEEDGEFSVV